MTSQQFTLTEASRIINVPFTVKQFKVENPSSSFIYINLGGGNPSNIKSDYTIQPNSAFVSPVITTTNFSIVITSLKASSSPPTLTAYSTAEQSASISPYTSGQFVGSFPGYPYIVNDPTLINFPSVFIDKYQVVSVSLTGSPDVPFGNFLVTVSYQTSNPSLRATVFAGIIGYNGGVVSFVSPAVPNNYIISITSAAQGEGLTPFNFPASAFYTVDVFQVGQQIDDYVDTSPLTQRIFTGQPAAAAFWFNPPGFIYSITLGIVNNNLTALNITFNISIRVGGYKVLVDSFTYIGTLTATVPVIIISGKVKLVASYGICIIEGVVNSETPANEPLNVEIGFSNL